MSAQAYSAFKPMAHPRSMVCGVCVRMAANTGMPVWVPRAAFVVLALMHTVLAAVLYVGAAVVCHRAKAPAMPGPTAAPRPYHRSAGEGDTLRSRFDRLDARLAAMEAEAAGREAGLRQAFRDLESK